MSHLDVEIESMETYRHSGRTPLGAAAISLLTGLFIALIGAFAYAWSVQWIPLIYINFLATLAFGALVGGAVGVVARVGRIRSDAVVGLIALFCMAVGVWLYWGASFWAMFGPEAGLRPWGPTLLSAYVQHLFENGSWGLKDGDPIKGWFLTAVWVVEIGLLFVVAWATALACVNQPFCESCGEWTETESAVARFDAKGDEAVWQRVITDDLPALGEVPLLSEDKPNYVRLDFAKCPKCEHSNFMTLQAVEITTDSKGNTKTKERKLLVHGILTAEQSQIIRHLATMTEEEPVVDAPAHNQAALSENDTGSSEATS